MHTCDVDELDVDIMCYECTGHTPRNPSNVPIGRDGTEVLRALEKQETTKKTKEEMGTLPKT